jgi:hypothetical protein
MRQELILEGVLAVCCIVLLMAGLWGFVFLVLNDSSRSRLAAHLRQRAGLAPTGMATHSGSAGAGSDSAGSGNGPGNSGRPSGVGTGATPGNRPS